VNAVKPRYQQLKDLIIQRISTGELQPSDRVPSENELVEAMSVSRMTANRALRELNDEGYVKRIAGRGTFVSDFRSQSHLLEVQNTPARARRSRPGAARRAGHGRLSPAARAP
jgi:GntR family histidine utilization transcriptional repressor